MQLLGELNFKGMGHCGFCAFYALNQRFNPKTPARTLQFLQLVVNPPKVKDIRLLPKAIEDWEAKKSKLHTDLENSCRKISLLRFSLRC